MVVQEMRTHQILRLKIANHGSMTWVLFLVDQYHNTCVIRMSSEMRCDLV